VAESPTRYEQAKALKPAAFRRLLGVRPETFTAMLQALREREGRKRKSGRPSKLPLEEQLLLTLEFWRDYPTLFSLAHRYGVHEATAGRTVERIETALLESRQFRLPGKKRLLEAGVEFEVVVVDVSETPVERPKKAALVLQRQAQASHAQGAGRR